MLTAANLHAMPDEELNGLVATLRNREGRTGPPAPPTFPDYWDALADAVPAAWVPGLLANPRVLPRVDAAAS